jgi:hypothetical protein
MGAGMPTGAYLFPTPQLDSQPVPYPHRRQRRRQVNGCHTRGVAGLPSLEGTRITRQAKSVRSLQSQVPRVERTVETRSELLKTSHEPSGLEDLMRRPWSPSTRLLASVPGRERRRADETISRAETEGIEEDAAAAPLCSALGS